MSKFKCSECERPIDQSRVNDQCLDGVYDPDWWLCEECEINLYELCSKCGESVQVEFMHGGLCQQCEWEQSPDAEKQAKEHHSWEMKQLKKLEETERQQLLDIKHRDPELYKWMTHGNY